MERYSRCPRCEKGLELVHENLERLAVSDDIRVFAESRSIPPNAGNIRHEYPFTGPQDVHRIEAHLHARPYGSTKELRLILETSDGKVINKQASLHDHVGVDGRISPEKDYILAVETTVDGNVSTTYSLEAQYFTDNPDGQTDPFANVDPSNITADTPKVVGWYNEEARFESEPTAKPRAGNAGEHGTYQASVMAGTGRASAIDESTVTAAAPQKILHADEHLVYEVEASPGTGVFGAAFGERIQIEIFGPDGDFLTHTHRDASINQTHVTKQALTVHETGTKTYEVHVHPRRETHTFSATSEAPARVKRVCVGAFRKPDSTAGDRCAVNPTLHAGIAPNAGLVGLSGYLKTRRDLKHRADDFARLFNMRALVIKLGYDKSLGIAGGTLSEGSVEAMKALAEAGVLPVSRTENIQAGSQADKSPGIADEAITVAEAGPWDGIYIFQKNEPAAVDEDESGIYQKPDVTAPALDFPPYEAVTAAEGGDPFRPENEQSPIRDYAHWETATLLDAANVPFVGGTAGLVAQALEEKAPTGISLPSPEKAGFAETMRLKQTILATASETPFTAEPWHNREPTYDFGGHDPIEGWGRVNIDAAVEATARDLTPPSARGEERQQGQPPTTTSITETVGLKLPRDSRAVAGHIAGRPGDYEVTLKFDEYSGQDKPQEGGPAPHIDLFVYDAENPAKHGTPNIVTKAQASTGSASVQFTAGQSTDSGTTGGTYYVVAKLVNVPGAFNSFDIQAKFDLSVTSL